MEDYNQRKWKDQNLGSRWYRRTTFDVFGSRSDPYSQVGMLSRAVGVLSMEAEVTKVVHGDRPPSFDHKARVGMESRSPLAKKGSYMPRLKYKVFAETSKLPNDFEISRSDHSLISRARRGRPTQRGFSRSLSSPMPPPCLHHTNTNNITQTRGYKHEIGTSNHSNPNHPSPPPSKQWMIQHKFNPLQRVFAIQENERQQRQQVVQGQFRRQLRSLHDFHRERHPEKEEPLGDHEEEALLSQQTVMLMEFEAWFQNSEPIEREEGDDQRLQELQRSLEELVGQPEVKEREQLMRIEQELEEENEEMWACDVDLVEKMMKELTEP